MNLSVVVPVYNSEGSLEPLLGRLEPVLRALAERFEVILVDDGSTDASAQVMGRLAAGRQWVRAVHLSRNYGQHNALLCGIRLARHEITVTLDDDLQHPPEEIPKLLEKLGEGFDVVYGTPESERHGLARDLASQITKLALQSAMGATIARQVSAFRVFRTPLREAFARYEGSFVSIDVLLTWASTRFGAASVRHEPRTIGASNYTFGKLVTHAFNMMTGFSTLPLQIASILGFVLTLFGVAILLYVLGGVLFYGRVVPGFAFLASTIAIFAGAQLFALGIIGEYLARMHFRVMGKPAYLVREGAAHEGEEK